MDFYAMSSLMKNLIPSDPQRDREALLKAAKNPVGDVPVTKDYVNESAQVAPGSLPLNLDLAGLTALAGVKHNPKYLKEEPEVAVPTGPDPSLLPGLTKTKADVGSEDPAVLVQAAIRRAMDGEVMTPKHREAFAPYAKMLERILEEPRLAQMLDNIIKIANREDAAKEPAPEEPAAVEPEKTESIVAMLNKQLKEHMEKNNV